MKWEFQVAHFTPRGGTLYFFVYVDLLLLSKTLVC